MGDGSGSGGDGGSDGSLGSDSTGFGTEGTLGGFGADSDAAAAAAAISGLASGISGIGDSDTGFGTTDPGSLGTGVGYGGVSGLSSSLGEGVASLSDAGLGGVGPGPAAGSTGGGFGIGDSTSVGGTVGGLGGFGGLGSAGNIASPSDAGFGFSNGFGEGSIAGIGPSAAGFGLGPSDSLGINSNSDNAALGQSVAAALGTLGETSSPAQAAAPGPNFGATFGEFGTQSQESPAVAAITAAINDALGPQVSFNVPAATTPTDAELGIADTSAPISNVSSNLSIPGSIASPVSGAFSPATAVGISPAESIAQAQSALANQGNVGPAAQSSLGIGSDAIGAPSQPSLASMPSAAQIAEGYATMGQQGIPSVGVNEPSGTSMGFQGFSPSPQGVTGVAPGVSMGFQGFSPSINTAENQQETSPAPSPATATAGPSPSLAAPMASSVSAPNPAGSQDFAGMLAQYPWLPGLLERIAATS